MAARELRYKWFEEIRKEYGYDSIAVAHNLNDNIETLLINLVRGTGLAGMAGMKPVNNKLIRPLLFATRKKIAEFRDLNNIEFREDRSNADTKYTRNKIRHLIIPLLKEINPSIESTLNETAERFSGYNETLLSDLVKVIKGKTGGQIITATHRIIKNRKELEVSDEEINHETSYIINNIQDFSIFPGISSVEDVRITKNFKINPDPHLACIDYQKISYPLKIRKWKPGDHFYPLGMKRMKKLSDYFIDNKYSKFDKENIFILESDGKIVWIIGDRIDDRFKITGSTAEGLLIKSK